MNLAFYLVFPLMVILTVLQSSLLNHFPLFGVVPQLWLLATVAWALLRGWQEGILWAFIAGFFIDIFSAAPLGVTSLALMATVGVVILLQRNLPKQRVILPVIMTVVGTIIFWLLYILFLRITVPFTINRMQLLGLSGLLKSTHAASLMSNISSGYSIDGPMFRYILFTAFLHSMLVLPFYWGLSILEQLFKPRSVEL